MPEHGNYGTACCRIPIKASTHPGQASRREACRNWVAIAASWCDLKGSVFFFPPRTQCDGPSTPLILSNEPPVAPSAVQLLPQCISDPGLLQSCPEGHSCSHKYPFDQAVRQRVLSQDLHHQLSKGMPLVLAAAWALCVYVANSNTSFQV